VFSFRPINFTTGATAACLIIAGMNLYPNPASGQVSVAKGNGLTFSAGDQIGVQGKKTDPGDLQWSGIDCEISSVCRRSADAGAGN
jgi:hypothetical protein